MADVKVKSGGYTIPARTTEDFTFWWGADYFPAGYFDVSIAAYPVNSGLSICGSGVLTDRPALFLGLSRLMRSQ